MKLLLSLFIEFVQYYCGSNLSKPNVNAGSDKSVSIVYALILCVCVFRKYVSYIAQTELITCISLFDRTPSMNQSEYHYDNILYSRTGPDLCWPIVLVHMDERWRSSSKHRWCCAWYTIISTLYMTAISACTFNIISRITTRRAVSICI